MAYTTTNIHGVKSIKAEVKQLRTHVQTITTDFIFILEDGSTIYVTAFSKDFLQIEGAEHVNTVASAQEPS